MFITHRDTHIGIANNLRVAVLKCALSNQSKRSIINARWRDILVNYESLVHAHEPSYMDGLAY